ncbi:hypothetical protein [Streptomyces sp. NBC_00893]|nr:hypothetical protein [Streptomyces sp. NBC_00893]MCX4851964.1 hypothetical protein [Streptomyces sp. NBC_00893]
MPDRAQDLQHVGSHRLPHLDRVTTTLRQHHSTHPRVRALLADLPHAA